MEVTFYPHENFDLNVLKQQIDNGKVGIGFSAGNLKTSVHGHVLNGKWACFATIERDGKSRTMSRVNLNADQAKIEFERAISSGRAMCEAAAQQGQ